MWVSDQVPLQLHELAANLATAFPRTGLWPIVVVDSLGDSPQRSWSDGELDVAHRTAPTTVDLAAVGTNTWADSLPSPLSYISPYEKAYPGLAPELTGGPLRSPFVDVLNGTDGRLALVPVRRPADVPYAIGWLGAANYFDSGVVSAFLRSEEDRWGAVLVQIGSDHLELALQRPPRTLAEARSVAGEQLGFCPDEVVQGDFETLEEYATSLVGRTEISCWWD